MNTILLLPMFVVAVASATSLTHPVICVDARVYMDGGTIGTTLVGARRDTLRGGFEGRMQEGGNSYPRHCFVGAEYSCLPGARFLPLWGAEERAFVALVQEGLASSLSRERRDRYLAARTAIHLSPAEVGYWHLLRAVARRRQLLNALDRGEMVGEEATSSWFELKRPLTIKSIVNQEATNEFQIIVDDRAAKRYEVNVPRDSLLGTIAPTRLGGRKMGLIFPVGSMEDRYLMTLVSIAFRDDHRSQEDRDHREQVARLLQIRRRQILADDARR